MARAEDEERDYRIGGLSDFQSGMLFVFLALAIVLYVGYQVIVGRVYTKSGEVPLDSQFGLAFVSIELVAAVVGFVRGCRMIQRDSDS